MNLNYVKEYLDARKMNISRYDVDCLIEEIEDYQKTESSFTDIAKIMRVINEYNVTYLTLVEAYEACPKNDIKLLPKRTEKVREILCTLSALHTYLVLSISSLTDATYEMKNLRIYKSTL